MSPKLLHQSLILPPFVTLVRKELKLLLTLRQHSPFSSLLLWQIDKIGSRFGFGEFFSIEIVDNNVQLSRKSGSLPTVRGLSHTGHRSCSVPHSFHVCIQSNSIFYHFAVSYGNFLIELNFLCSSSG